MSLREALRGMMCDLISAHSEDIWAAQWMRGIEDDVHKQGGQWLVMAWVCGGWPKGYRGEDGWEPLDATELAEIYQMDWDK